MLSARLSCPNLASFQRALRQVPALAERQFGRAAAASGAVVLSALVDATPKRTGQTAGAWTLRVEGSGMNAAAFVENPSAVAAMLDQGTQPHVILPRRARFLRFQAGGRVVYARRVFHPGTRATYFVDSAIAGAWPKVLRIWAGHAEVVTRAFKA